MNIKRDKFLTENVLDECWHEPNKEEKMEVTRFDLEQAIMDGWNTSNDLRLISEMYCDRVEPMKEDELMNLLIGLEYQHNLRSQKIFNVMEELISNERLK